MSNVVGSLVVRLSAHIAEFVSGLDSAAAKAKTAGSSIGASLSRDTLKPATDQMKTFSGFVSEIGETSGLGGFLRVLQSPIGKVGAGIALSVESFRRVADHMHDSEKAAEKLGVSLDVFERMRALARQGGIGVDEFSTHMLRMEKNVSEAMTGSGTAFKAFKELKLDPAELMGMSPDKAFEQVAQAVMGVHNRFERARLEVDLFGRSGAQLEGVLSRAAEGLGKLSARDYEVPFKKGSEALARWGEAFEVTGVKIKVFATDILGALAIGLDRTLEKIAGVRFQLPDLVGLPDELQARAARNTAAKPIVENLQAQLDTLRRGGDDLDAIMSQVARINPGDAMFRQVEDLIERIRELRDHLGQVRKEEELIKKLGESEATQFMSPFGRMRYEANQTIQNEAERQRAVERINRMEDEANKKKAREFAQQFTETPIDRFVKGLETLRQAQLPDDQFNRAVGRLRERAVSEMAGGFKAAGPAPLAAYGTQAAASAIAQAQMGNQVSEQVRLARQQVKVAEDQLKVANRIADNTEPAEQPEPADAP